MNLNKLKRIVDAGSDGIYGPQKGNDGTQSQQSWILDQGNIGDMIAGNTEDALGAIGGTNISGPSTDYLGQQSDALKALYGGVLGGMSGFYGNLMQEGDRSVVDQVNQDIATRAQTNLERNLLPAIADSAQQAGGIGGSRQGIAAGLATSDVAGQVMQQQNQNLLDWQQTQFDRRMAGASGMLNLAGMGIQGIGQLGDLAQQQSMADWKEQFGSTEAGQALLRQLLMGAVLSPVAGLGTTAG